MSSSPGFLFRLVRIVSVAISLAAAGWFFALARFALSPLGAAIAAGLLVLALGVALWNWRSRLGRLMGLPVIILLGVAVLYRVTPPRNDRVWESDDSQTPWTEVTGDVATIHNFRNFDWSSATTAVERWETRSVHLSNLRGVDFIMVYWEGVSHDICHTMLSFDFGPEGFVCASVDARMEKNESYSPLAGIFRSYEILYVFGDERDVVRMRTNFQKDDLHLYRLNTTPERARALFTDYLRRANELRDRPAWYNTLTTNCTTTIRHHAQLLNLHNVWSWQVLLNGHLDSFLYERGRFASELPLAELRERGAITAVAQTAPLETFSTAIRAPQPTP